MIRRDKHERKRGTLTQIRVVEGYRDKNNKSKQRTIKNFGYLEDQEDPEAFMRMVEEFDANYKKEKRVNISVQSTKPFYEEESSKAKNFGYKYIETIVDSLGLKEVFQSYEYKGQHDLYEIFKFLVIGRILIPDSKRATFQSSKALYGKNYSFQLYDIYRSLPHFNNLFDEIQNTSHVSVSKLLGRDLKTLFFDTTNYYFERDLEDDDVYVEVSPIVKDKKIIDKLKLVNITDQDGVERQYVVVKGLAKRGVSKEHRVDPIVQMGLIMDSKGVPLCMEIFPGNTADSLTLLPIIEKMKGSLTDPFLLCADKGINTTENIDALQNSGNDYMFSQILKGKKGKRYHERLFDESLYTVVDEDYKYQLFEEEYASKDSEGKVITRKRKVLLYWDKKAAERDEKKRLEKLVKAEKSTKNGAYNLEHGYKQYLNIDGEVASTGEIADTKLVSVNYEKAKKDAMFDGYFAIITSKLDYDEKKIRETYHGLWRIEESFKISKSELNARPVFLKLEEHIRAHFLICYIALIVLRILQNKMNYSLSVERIKRALNSCACSTLAPGTIHCFLVNTFEEYEEVELKNKKYYKLSLDDNKNETVEDLKKILSYYDSQPVSSIVNKSQFDKYFKKIKLK